MDLGKNITLDLGECFSLNLNQSCAEQFGNNLYHAIFSLRSSVYDVLRTVRFLILMDLFEIVKLHNEKNEFRQKY